MISVADPGGITISAAEASNDAPPAMLNAITVAGRANFSRVTGQTPQHVNVGLHRTVGKVCRRADFSISRTGVLEQPRAVRRGVQRQFARETVICWLNGIRSGYFPSRIQPIWIRRPSDGGMSLNVCTA